MSVLSTQINQLMDSLLYNLRMNPQRYVKPKVLRQIYRKYCNWKHLTLYAMTLRRSTLNNPELDKYHEVDRIVVHYLLERFYWLQYGDSVLISHLLSSLYELDGHLGKIFDQQMLQIRPHNCGTWMSNWHKVFSTWTESVVSNEIIKPLDYFLRHANKNKLLFGGQRMQEQLIVMSVIEMEHSSDVFLFLPPCALCFRIPEILKKLLQYGLFVNAPPNDPDVLKLLSGILSILISSRKDAYFYKIAEMGNTLLRAVRSIHVDAMLERRECHRWKNGTVRWMLTNSKVQEALPYLTQRFQGPQDLQHLCRHAIRKQLHQNWALPDGLTFICLPQRLKKYINLECDW